MNCGSCNEMIPDDSMFCPECGARQDNSIAGSFQPSMPQRDFEPVAGMNARMQQEANMGAFPNMQQDQFQNMAQNIQQNHNLPPNMYQQHQMGFPNQNMPMGNPNMMGRPQNVVPMNNQMMNVPTSQPSDLPKGARGPSLGSGAVPLGVRGQFDPSHSGGTMIAHNPEVSQTDAMVNRLAEAERAVKDERRSQWLNMNQNAATDVLSSLGGDIPQHLKSKGTSEVNAAQILAGTKADDSPNDALLRRMAEVASRRVARKRGVAVESPQVKLVDDILTVNLTYIDDGRVLDTPEDLIQAFEQAIQTEIALKGYDFTAEIHLFRNKDGKTEKIGEGDSEEEMFACEMCDGLVKESDPKCPHCGAMFEEEEPEPSHSPPTRGGGPPGPSRSGGPPGPSKSSGPPGPSKSGGPPGPSKSGGPPGPSKSGGPPTGGPGGGPPGPSKSGGPPTGGPGGGPPGPSKSGGPPGPSKSGGPPGPSKSGGPPGPSKSGGPPGPSKSGGPPTGGPGGGPPGPSKSGGPPRGGPGGGPPGPSKSGGPPRGGPGGGPPGPSKSGGPPGPSKSGGPPKGGPGGGPPGPSKSGGPPKGGPGGGPPGPKKGGPPGPRK